MFGGIHHSWLCDVSKILPQHIADVEMLPSSICKNFDNNMRICPTFVLVVVTCKCIGHHVGICKRLASHLHHAELEGNSKKNTLDIN
jgi:hypothetical protein